MGALALALVLLWWALGGFWGRLGTSLGASGRIWHKIIVFLTKMLQTRVFVHQKYNNTSSF
jgi:hypothetical protein